MVIVIPAEAGVQSLSLAWTGGDLNGFASPGFLLGLSGEILRRTLAKVGE